MANENVDRYRLSIPYEKCLKPECFRFLRFCTGSNFHSLCQAWALQKKKRDLGAFQIKSAQSAQGSWKGQVRVRVACTRPMGEGNWAEKLEIKRFLVFCTMPRKLAENPNSKMPFSESIFPSFKKVK